MKAVVLILALIALPASALAQEEETCDGTTYDMSICLSRILKKVEIQLNSTYQRALMVAMKVYTAREMQELRIAERRWIAYRDAACNAEYGLWGAGSGGPLARMGCLIRISKQRIADLNNAYRLDDRK